METPVVMPPMGDAAGDLVVEAWYKQVGDEIVKGEPLFQVATDKVTIDIEALVTGRLNRIVHEKDSTAEIGEIVAYIEVNG
jgi:pyruvate/2-oxoglutarate dehydrogenase complex dihydrolipoamide acyltransferase (E2) component